MAKPSLTRRSNGEASLLVGVERLGEEGGGEAVRVATVVQLVEVHGV